MDRISDPANHVTSFPRAVTNKKSLCRATDPPTKVHGMAAPHPGGGSVESSPIRARAAASFPPPGGGGVPVGEWVSPPPSARRGSPTGDGVHRLHVLGEQRSIHDGSRTTRMMSQPRRSGSNEPTTTPAMATCGDTFLGPRWPRPAHRRQRPVLPYPPIVRASSFLTGVRDTWDQRHPQRPALLSLLRRGLLRRC